MLTEIDSVMQYVGSAFESSILFMDSQGWTEQGSSTTVIIKGSAPPLPIQLPMGGVRNLYKNTGQISKWLYKRW